MARLSAQVHKLMGELDEAADSRTAFRSRSNRIGCVGADFFIGLKVAEIRKVAERYAHICLDEIEQLLLSEVHEHRMCALIILKKGSNGETNMNGQRFSSSTSTTRTVSTIGI